ncbi:MAG: cell surface protein [Methanobacteriaceae archaeon]|nr:cell surface protein [Methanobacteriaceae archaeon]
MIKDKVVSFLSFGLIFIFLISFSCINEINAAQWNVGEGKDYATIQEAIDNENTLDDDIINVYSGTYLEDVLVYKRLTIQSNNGDDVELKPTTTGFTILKDIIGDGSGTTISGFKITNSIAGIGINISADNCVVDNNKIIGGRTGIVVSNSNNTIINNVISDQSENGVVGNLTGGFFKFNGNTISNIIGPGTANGITITINGTLNSLTTIGNVISNINAFGGNAYGIQIGKSKGVDGNPEVANINVLTITKNKINGIRSTVASAVTGIELVCISKETLISENNMQNLNGVDGSTIFGLEAAIIGTGTVNAIKNQVSQISGGEQAAGIVVVSFGNLNLNENFVSNISRAKAAIGILGLGLGNSVNIEDNIVSNIKSPNVAAGLVGVCLKDLFMLHNNIFQVKGTRNANLVAAGFNQANVKGNNLEGDGSGIGIVICSFNGKINYNRIVNFDHYVQNFLFSSFGPSIDEMLKPLDDAIKKHPELEPILKPIRDDLNNLFHKLENSNTNARYNWYGTNNPNSNNFFKGNGTLIYSPWLVLSIKANPSTIYAGQTSLITADVYKDSAGRDHSANAAQFFSGPRITFTTNLGNVGSKSITVPWIKGRAIATLRADEGPGIATVTASDHQTVKTFVKILGGSNKTSKTVGMQKTGVPVQVLIFAILFVLGGFVITRRK